MKRILVFTGGGLAPALNSTIYGVAEAAKKNNTEVFGGFFGWASLLPGGKYTRIDNLDLTSIKNHGGTILRSSRTNPFKVEGSLEYIKNKIAELKLDGIVAIGGDDTLGAAARLFDAGVPIVGIPKTIDNDLSGTYFTPGFPSAAYYLKIFTRQIKEDAAYTLSRIFVIESLGMKAGWLAASSIYGGADVIIPPEGIYDLDKVLQTIQTRYKKNGNYAVVVVSQEASFTQNLGIREEHQINEQYGHKRQSFICLTLKEIIKEKLGIDTKALYPGNFLEADEPVELDKTIAWQLGEKAVELIKNGQFGQMSTVVREDKTKMNLGIGTIPLQDVAGANKYRSLPEDFFNKEEMKPTQKFLDYMAPLAGVFDEKEDDYTRLIKIISAST